MYARSRLRLGSRRRDSARGESGRAHAPRSGRLLSKALIAVALAGGIGGVAASPSQATDALFLDGPLDVTTGAWGGYVNLVQIDLRSLDTHSSCFHAYSTTLGWTADLCTNDLRSATYGGLLRAPHAYPNWGPNNTYARGRYYW